MRVFIISIFILLMSSYCYGQGCDSNTQLLLHMDGSDASTTFTDENCDGSGAHTVTANGDAQLDTGITKFGTATGLFDGTGDYLTIPDSSDWDMLASTGDAWTLTAFIKLSATSANRNDCYIFARYASASQRWFFTHLEGSPGNDKLQFYLWDGAWRNGCSSANGTGISDSNWHHVAFVKDASNNEGIYLDGSQICDGTFGTTAAINTQMSIAWNGTSVEFEGSMDEVMITNSNYFNASPVPGLTDTITVPTEAYSVASAGQVIIITKREFVPAKVGKGYDKMVTKWTQNFGWNGIEVQLAKAKNR